MTDERAARKPTRLTHPGATINTVKWTRAHQWCNRIETGKANGALFLPHSMLPITLNRLVIFNHEVIPVDYCRLTSVSDSLQIVFVVYDLSFISCILCLLLLLNKWPILLPEKRRFGWGGGFKRSSWAFMWGHFDCEVDCFQVSLKGNQRKFWCKDDVVEFKHSYRI